MRTILCIDDDPETLKLRKQVLETSDYIVLTALSGPEGLKIISDDRAVDVVVLDYSMPEMKGDELADILKRLYPQIPIVVMSAFPHLPEELLRITDGYVRKGQDPEFLLAAIAKSLAKYESGPDS